MNKISLRSIMWRTRGGVEIVFVPTFNIFIKFTKIIINRPNIYEALWSLSHPSFLSLSLSLSLSCHLYCQRISNNFNYTRSGPDIYFCLTAALCKVNRGLMSLIKKLPLIVSWGLISENVRKTISDVEKNNVGDVILFI